MDFLGIGPLELLLILILALMIFGPMKLPELGHTLGKAIHDFRKATSELTRDIAAEREGRAGQRTQSTARDDQREKKEPE